MKTLVIDCRMISLIPHGFSRYVSSLIEGLSEIPEKPYRVVGIVNHETPKAIHRFLDGLIKIRSSFLSFREIYEIPQVLKKSRASLYHSPTFSSLAYCPCPWIVTVHDLNHLQYGGLREKIYYQMFLKPFLKRARRILTVSEFSRHELAEWLQLDFHEIQIAHNAIKVHFEPLTKDFCEAVLKKQGLIPQRYFLSLSNSKPHKNLPFLVDAFSKFYSQRMQKSDVAEWKLALSVNDFQGVPGVVPLGGVSDEEARALLHAAGAVAFPSLYEGFGIPPVEAAMEGVGIIASSIPPHREGLAQLKPGEVYWADPHQEAEWIEAFHAFARGKAKTPSSQSQLKIREAFSVQKLAQLMDAIYRENLNRSVLNRELS